MEAKDILNMTLRQVIDGQHDFTYESEPAGEYTDEITVGSWGSYFDKSFGNYLPVDPPTAQVELYEYAHITLYCDGVPFAEGNWELPSDYFEGSIEVDEDIVYVYNHDDLVNYYAEEMMAETDDTGSLLTEVYYDADTVAGYFGGDYDLTVGQILSSSSIFTPLA